MSRDIHPIAADIPIFLATLPSVPWFKNVGKPHPRDRDVMRIGKWQEWHGPEQGYGDWFGRFPAVVREHLEASHIDRKSEMDAIWHQVERMVMELAIPNVPEYRADEDAWYGPTTCVWFAGYSAALIGCHILLSCPLPDPIADQWSWLLDGHWPCDYAEEPPGYGNELLIDVPASKLVVY